MTTDVIIIGGGPAGSTCAWTLRRLGIKCLVLDRAVFPRPKLCAGWITPRVVRLLEMDDYPHGLTTFTTFHLYFRGRRIPLRTRQYAVRRGEFDHWLLKRADVPVRTHLVQKVRKMKEGWSIDEQFSCRFIVGAGGTHCPVYYTLFKHINPRAGEHQIAAMEDEFRYDYTDPDCRLWFWENGLPGYSWYVPKADGFLNVGVGGVISRIKARNSNIARHWDHLTHKLSDLGLVQGHDLERGGHNYFLRHNTKRIWTDSACVIGDAAGLATRDLGEGIGPAVQSGMLAAHAIANGKSASYASIPRYSLPRMILAGCGLYV